MHSQSLDNIGKEFIVCFPENDDYENIGTKLQIIITNYSDIICNVEIDYLLDSRKEKSKRC